MSTLTATALAKQYHGRKVVKSIDLQLTQGEIVGLLGPNGAGKTTSFYMLVGLVKCDEGSITLDGEVLTHLPMHARARKGLAYLPQEASVFRKLTVAENILAILELNSALDEKQRVAQLASLLNAFNLTHLQDILGLSLSGGERRRVEIARVLACNPKFILLDEPFAGVDPISIKDIQSIIKQVAARNIGVLITDHNVRETLQICERAYIVGEGEIIAHGLPSEITNNPQVKSIYLGEDFK